MLRVPLMTESIKRGYAANGAIYWGKPSAARTFRRKRKGDSTPQEHWLASLDEKLAHVRARICEGETGTKPFAELANLLNEREDAQAAAAPVSRVRRTLILACNACVYSVSLAL